MSSAQPQCDTDWPDGQTRIIQIEKRKDDGKPLEPFKPDDPLYPYEIRGSRYLFRDKRMIYTVAGKFDDDQEGEAALRTLEARRPASRPFLTTPGAYLVTEAPTCKITEDNRSNAAIDSASWILEREGVLLAGVQSGCSNGTVTKKVTVISCNGMKNLLTDTVKQVCDRPRRVDTCVYTLEPGVLLLKHKYTIEGATDVYLRVYDVRKKKRLYNQEESYGPGLPGLSPYNTEPKTDVEDVDQDGIPEIVSSQPRTGERLSVRKWQKGKFVETRSP